MERLPSDRSRHRRRFRPQGELRVLIAESDRVLADLYQGAMQPGGWEVDVVHDGQSALDRIRSSPPDVLLVDTLPDYDPISLIEKVRGDARTRHIAVVVLLDTVDHLDLRRAEELGVLAWLIKNRVTRDTLYETVKGLFENQPRPGSERDQD